MAFVVLGPEPQLCLSTLLEKQTLTFNQLPDEAIHVPLGGKKPIAKSGWGSMLSGADESPALVSCEKIWTLH